MHMGAWVPTKVDKKRVNTIWEENIYEDIRVWKEHLNVYNKGQRWDAWWSTVKATMGITRLKFTKKKKLKKYIIWCKLLS